MKVWLVEAYPDHGATDIVGVFDSYEKAKEFLVKNNYFEGEYYYKSDHRSITEWDVE